MFLLLEYVAKQTQIYCHVIAILFNRIHIRLTAIEEALYKVFNYFSQCKKNLNIFLLWNSRPMHNVM